MMTKIVSEQERVSDEHIPHCPTPDGEDCGEWNLSCQGTCHKLLQRQDITDLTDDEDN